MANAVTETFEVKQDGTLNGLKTVIGVLLIMASHNIDALKDIALMLPHVELVATIQGYLEMFVSLAEKALLLLGSGFMVTGLGHKIVKFVKGIFGKKEP